MDRVTRLSNLVDELLEKTAQGKIRWERTDQENAFLYSGPSGSIQIGSTDQVTMRIFNAEGHEVEFTEETEFLLTRGAGGTRSRLRELFDSARRQALNTDAVIESLLGDIEKET